MAKELLVAEAVGIEALGPIALIGAVAIGAYMLFGQGGDEPEPGGPLNWFLEGVSGGQAARGSVIGVNVRHIDLPHDALRIAAATLSPGGVVDPSTWRQWAAGREPMQVSINTGYYGQGAGILIALEVLYGGLIVATGAPGQAGYDARLSKAVQLL